MELLVSEEYWHGLTLEGREILHVPYIRKKLFNSSPTKVIRHSQTIAGATESVLHNNCLLTIIIVGRRALNYDVLSTTEGDESQTILHA